MNANVKNDYNKVLNPKNGMAMLLMLILGELVAIAGFVGGIVMLDSGFLFPLSLILVILCAILAFIVLPILFGGLRTLRPNEAYVLTLFGEYYGTLYGPGFYFINPFASPINPASENALEKAAAANAEAALSGKATTANVQLSTNKRVSLKEITLTNDKQKINDQLGNPVIIGTVVIWHVTDPAKAVFNVDNYVGRLHPEIAYAGVRVLKCQLAIGLADLRAGGIADRFLITEHILQSHSFKIRDASADILETEIWVVEVLANGHHSVCILAE